MPPLKDLAIVTAHTTYLPEGIWQTNYFTAFIAVGQQPTHKKVWAESVTQYWGFTAGKSSCTLAAGNSSLMVPVLTQ